jgi:prevent-host-death family protein
METIGVSKLRENLPTYIKKIQQGQTITITSHGNRIAMLVPVESETVTSRNALRNLRKTAHVGDVVSPIDEKWESME